MGTAPDIILIGASVRSLAVSAIRDGLRPLCIDLFGDADLAELLEGCAGQLLRVNQFEDVPSALAGCRQKLPVVLSGGIENQSSLVRTLSEHYPIAGPGLEAIESVRNPAKLFATLARCGCCVPAWYDSSHRLSVANRTNVRWLTKVRLSSGGTGVSLGNDITDADNQYVQEFVDGTLVSATFLLN